MTVEVRPTHPPLDTAQRRRLGRRARALAGLSAGYNVAEGAVAITVGVVTGSSALLAFGLDSAIEVSSAFIILWQFSHVIPQDRERLALRLMAVAFFSLAALVVVDSMRALAAGREPDTSALGIGLVTASLVVMPLLSRAQRRTGEALGSKTVVADATQTLLCVYLSVVVLVGLALNALFGWSWADPVAGLVVAGIAVREGVLAWRGEGCCAIGTC